MHAPVLLDAPHAFPGIPDNIRRKGLVWILSVRHPGGGDPRRQTGFILRSSLSTEWPADC